jgi:hypothetical protein
MRSPCRRRLLLGASALGLLTESTKVDDVAHAKPGITRNMVLARLATWSVIITPIR